jgi:hypothetical protein
MQDGWYIDNEGVIIGKDKKDDDKVYLVVGNDANKVKIDNFEEGVGQKELNDPVEMPTLNERGILNSLYDLGIEDKKQEYGMLVYTNLTSGVSSGVLYKSPVPTTMEDGDIKGSLKFVRKNRMMVPVVGDPYAGDEQEAPLKIIAHLHNVEDGKAHPPTVAADKLSGGATTGVVFDYETGGNNAYIFNEKTKFRSKSTMKVEKFFQPFVTPDGKKL